MDGFVYDVPDMACLLPRKLRFCLGHDDERLAIVLAVIGTW